ncbi:MAG: exopolysaccharide Pel transporter PelG [Alphaproteobacteria bacterium]
MAGIGFALRKLVRRDDLIGIIQGYSHSALVSTGPWLFTVISLGSISFFTAGVAPTSDLVTFRLIVIYNFAFSLVLTGPVMMVTTRYLADMVFLKQVGGAVGMFLGALMLAYGTQLVLVGPFYLAYVQLDLGIQILSIFNYLVITGIWLASVFLTALKDYASITRAFALGMVISAFGAVALSYDWGAAGLLLGFTLGLVVILFWLIARVFVEYAYTVREPFTFLSYFRRYWELAVAGLFQGAAIWIDKWLMWFAPERDLQPSGLISYPFYDTATFMAYLTVVPAIAGFVVSVETGFFEKYLRFYRDIQRHATLGQITENQRALVSAVLRGLRNLVILQGSITFVVIALAPRLFEATGVPIGEIGMFRICVLGSFFHVLTSCLAVILAYFDLRKAVLSVYMLLFVTNTVFTLATLELGFAYYGYGFFLSAILSFGFSVILVAHYLGQLPFLTFVRNNTSVE